MDSPFKEPTQAEIDQANAEAAQDPRNIIRRKIFNLSALNVSHSTIAAERSRVLNAWHKKYGSKKHPLVSIDIDIPFKHEYDENVDRVHLIVGIYQGSKNAQAYLESLPKEFQGLPVRAYLGDYATEE